MDCVEETLTVTSTKVALKLTVKTNYLVVRSPLFAIANAAGISDSPPHPVRHETRRGGAKTEGGQEATLVNEVVLKLENKTSVNWQSASFGAVVVVGVTNVDLKQLGTDKMRPECVCSN